MPQYLPLGNVNAPASWTLPAALQLQLGAVFAHFDGTSAAGSYIPTLQIVSDSGNTCLEIPMESSVAAGSSVEASWAPFLRSASTSTSSVQTAPSVATFYRSQVFTDPALTVPPDISGQPIIPWLHAALPSDGSITGPLISNQYVQFNAPGMCIEYLYTQWDSPSYLKASVIGTASEITESDQFSLGTSGTGASTAAQTYGDSTQYVRPNAHVAGDIIHAYASNGDSVSHDIVAAYLVVFFWPAPGYAGGIPGYP